MSSGKPVDPTMLTGVSFDRLRERDETSKARLIFLYSLTLSEDGSIQIRGDFYWKWGGWPKAEIETVKYFRWNVGSPPGEMAGK